jgi:SAM-dependent methyltransferase
MTVQQQSEPFVYGREYYEGPYHTGYYRLPERSPEEVNGEWAHMGCRKQCREAWAELGEPISGQVLEVGIHHGKTAVWMLEDFPGVEQLWGFDWSRVAVAFCKRIAHPRLVVLEADVQKLPMRAGWFDWINCTDMTEHLPQPVYERMISELCRVAKPDARLILKQGLSEHPAHIHRLSEEQLVADFTARGWRLVTDLPHRHHLLERA